MKAIIAHNVFGDIGLNGSLPWKSREDLRHFKKLTNGCKLLVGYNTSTNLPPLKGREIIIDDRYNLIETDLIDWCIGGKKTYEKYCHLFTELHVSIIIDQTIGDTTYPNFRLLNPECKVSYYIFQTDKTILDWYVKGFKDELRGSSSVESEYEILNKAYKMGARDAIIGDDLSTYDNRSESEILNDILKS
jgi:dihydrofolate reductase